MGKAKSLELQTKLEILRRLDKKEKVKDLAKTYKVSEGSISKMRKKSVEIRESAVEEQKMGWAKKKNLRTSKYKKVHVALFIWLVQEREKKKPINDLLLLTMASKFKLAFYDDANDLSMGFIHNFRKNKFLRKVKASGEKRAANHEEVVPFKEFFKNQITDYGFSLAQIYNADESGLYWKSIPEESIILPQETTDDVEGKNTIT